MRITSRSRDGDLTRFDIVVPRSPSGISLVPRPGHRLSVNRVVGYRSFPDSGSGPAVVLTSAQVCRPGGGA